MTTPMGLTYPTVLGTPGPTYATNINGDLSLIETHDHSSGKGNLVPTSGLKFDADFNFGLSGANINAYGLRSVRFAGQTAPLAGGSDVGCLYIDGSGNLWYNNGAGTGIQLTTSGAINVSNGLVGISYSGGQKQFVFQQPNVSPAQSAGVDVGPITLRDTANGANGITIQSPVSLASAYALTAPAGLPGSTLPLLSSSSGSLSFAQIGTSQIASQAVTRQQMANVAQQISGSSGNGWTNATTTPTAITSMSVTVTTSDSNNRPIMVFCIPDGNTGGSNQAFFSITCSNAFNSLALFQLKCSVNGAGATVVGQYLCGMTGVGSAISTEMWIPPSAVMFLYVPSAGAGTYQFTLWGAADAPNNTMAAQYMQLVAYEL